MINKHFTYINTSSEDVQLLIRVIVDGKKEALNINLEGNQVSPDLQSKVNVQYGKNAVIEGVDVFQTEINAAGKPVITKKSLMGETFSSAENILKKSVILDIETTSHLGGASITQIGIYDIGAKKANLFIPKANLLIDELQDVSGEESFQKQIMKELDLPDDLDQRQIKQLDMAYEMLKKGSLPGLSIDVDQKSKREIYEDLILNRKSILNRYGKKLDDYMIQYDRFQALNYAEDDAFSRANIQLTSDQKLKRELIRKITKGELTPSDVDSYLKSTLGIGTDVFDGGFVIQKGKTLRDIINNDMPDLLKGKVTWIANAAFESKQFGAQIRVYEEEAFQVLKENNIVNDLDRKNFSKKYQGGVYTEELKKINERIELSNLIDPDAGYKPLVTSNPFVDVLEGVSATSGDPFYITGSEYGKARVEAFRTGNFANLYEVLKRTTKEGSVRDIQDLVRMQQSLFFKEGVMTAEKPTALSIEVQARLAAFSERMRINEQKKGVIDFKDSLKGLFEKETHIAIGDVYQEEKVLRESFFNLEALTKAAAGDEELIESARRGKGDYFRALMVGKVQDYLNKPSKVRDGSGNIVDSLGLEDILLRQRAGRMFEDLVEQGFTKGGFKYKGYGVAEQLKRTGGLTTSEKVPINRRSSLKLFTFQEVMDELNYMNDYKSADRTEFLNEMQNTYREYFDEQGLIKQDRKNELFLEAKKISESASKQMKVFEDRFRSTYIDFTNSLKDFIGEKEKPTVKLERSIEEKKILKAFKEGTALPKGKLVATSIFETVSKNLGLYGIVAGGLFAISHKQVEEDKAVLVGNYQDFLDSQAKYFGNIDTYIDRVKDKYGMKMEGLQHKGIMAKIRSTFTDFGSPYNGPGFSSFVLEDNKLRAERNKYIRQQFGIRHFSEQGDIGLLFKRFLDTAFREQHGLSIGNKKFFYGEPILNQTYNMLRDQKNLRQKVIRKNEFDINVEDGDTITIKRKGSNNSSLSRFMGNTGGNFSFRLAGIDAPETAHADRPAQPFAEASKEMLQEIISKGEDIKLVMRPDDTTYGRQVAMLYVDGKNINLEMIKRGMASHLPYKSKGKAPIYDQRAFEKAQEYAIESKRGMWSTSYFQAYSEIVKGSGETLTFNTLANKTKVARSANLMSVSSIMDQASKVGMTSLIKQEIQGLNERLKYTQKISNKSVFTDDPKMSNYDIPSLQAYNYNTNTILSSLDQIKYDLNTQLNDSFSNLANQNQQRNINNLKLSQTSLNASTLHKEDVVEQNTLKQQRQITRMKRNKKMERMQHVALGNLFNSPIQHHRM